MATYAYLVDPENQFMTKSGTINTAGVLRVYDAATDDPVITYKDFMGTENEEAIQLDDNGRAIVIADSDKAYRLEVYDRYGTLLWTTTPLWCQAGGGGANIARTDIVSSDGTVEITKTVVGSTTTFDLSTDVDDGTDLLEWIRCDGFVLHDNGCYVPEYTAGTMDIGDDGVNLYADRYYHITGHIKAVKDNVVNQPFYDDVVVHFIGHNGEDEDVEYQTYKLDVDYSMAMPQIFEVSTDILAPSDIELLIKIDNAEISGATFSLEDLAIHRVFSGAPALPGGAASKPWVYEEFQEKLIPGTGITIDENNVISATAAQQQQADWAEANTGAITFIKNKPDLDIYATKEEVTEDLADKQDLLIEGDNITIIDNVISAKEQVNSDWNANSGVEQILNKPDLTQYATKTEVAEDLAGKQDVLTPGSNITIVNNVISATAEPQVNADWLSNSGVSEILNKPDLSVYAEKSELADYQPLLTPGTGITIDENNVISAEGGTFTQVNSDWDSTSGVSEILNKPDLSVYAEKSELAPVATSGSYNDLTDKPTIVGQVNSDWDATSGVEQILNKPDLSQYATQSDLDDKQDKLTAGDNVTIINNVISATAAPQVNADWDASSGVSAILNKPDLSVYATETELTTGLAGKQDNMVVLDYGTSTWSDFTTAYDKNAIVYCRVSTGTNQYRLAFMAYRTQTLVEFQYVRSVSTHNASQQGDQVFVYKLDSTNAWTTTTREMVLQANAGNGITRTVTTASGAGTIEWAVKAKANGGVTVDSNGVSVTNPVPSYDSSDADKVLGVVSDGVTTELQWVQGGGGGGTQVNSDWTATSGVAEILHKPNVKEVVAGTNVTISNVGNTVTISAEGGGLAQVNADWDSTSGVSEILNKPVTKNLVAGSNISITDDSSSITISATAAPQLNSDWNSNTGVTKILNKPNLNIYAKSANLATVATTGAYSDLSGTPTLATVATSGAYSDLSGKPNLNIYAKSANLATVATTGAYSDLSGTPTLATVATSGSYTDLTDKPTINNVPAVTSSDDNKVLKASYDGGVGSYSWEEAPATQVNSDWEATSGVAEILNKPDLVDIVAGPGIVVDNPDGNTLRVSMADSETVLWTGNAVTSAINLSEAPINFEYLRVYIKRQANLEGFTKILEFPVKTANVSFPLMLTYESIESATSYATYITRYNGNTSNVGFTFAFAQKISSTVGGSVTHASDSGTIEIYKITGIHRIATN